MTALITGLCIGGVQHAFAAEDLNTFALDEYVVTATRTMKQLQEVPASVSVVTAKDIEERNVNTVKEALQHLPGVYINQADNSDSSIMMRGFGSTDILILVDGQQMNTGYNGSVNLNSINVENIEKIEVLRGAASSIYGGHAVGGVISITTKEAKTVGTHGEAVVSYGSNDTWKKAIQVNSKVNDKIAFGIGYENRKSDGYKGYYNTKNASGTGGTYNAELEQLSNGKYVIGGRGERAWEHENYNANIKYNFDDNKALKYSFSKSESDWRYKNAFSYIKDSNGKPVFNGSATTQNGDKVSFKTGDFYGYDNFLTRETHAITYSDEENKFRTILSYVNNKDDGYTSPDVPNDYNANDWIGEGHLSQHPSKVYNINVEKAWENIGKHTIVLGADVKKEEMLQERWNLTSWKNADSKTDCYGIDEGAVKNIALYAQDEYKLSDPVTIYLGARIDYFKKGEGNFWGIGEKSGTEYDKTSSSESYIELSPKLAFDFKADDKTNYYVSYGHSFNPPEIYKIYRYSESSNYWYVPNPDLDPETSDTFEIGMKKQLSNKTDLGITLYHVDTDDKIATGPVDKLNQFNGKDTRKYINYNKEERNGIEFELNHKFNDSFSSYLNYAWQQGKLESDGTKSNVYDIPKHLLHAGLQYDDGKWNALLDCQYVSRRDDPSDDEKGLAGLEAYFLVNTAINYNINKDMTLQFAVYNLFDREFYGEGAVYPEATAGRTYNVSLRYSF